MDTVIGKKQLCSAVLKYFNAFQGIDNKPLYLRYKSAESTIIKKNIQSEYQDFLAYPIVSSDESEITFYGISYLESPKTLSDLTGEELTKYTNIKSNSINHYHNQIKLLRSTGKSTDADFLEGAIKFVDDRFIYCYDDKVVLGIWGMKLKDNIKKDLNEICKNLTQSITPSQKLEPASGNDLISEEEIVPHDFKIRFEPGEYGTLEGLSEYIRKKDDIINDDEIPRISAKEGYEFLNWGEIHPSQHKVSGDINFIAQYRKIPTPVVGKFPWYLLLWNWFKQFGCLKWLLWLLLLLLLIWLFFHFRSCNTPPTIPVSTENPVLTPNDSSWIHDDPRVRHDGTPYDPRNPYQQVPTPPQYQDILPPNEGVIPPINNDSEIIHGNPSIIANRLNILMEDTSKSIFDFAKDFKLKYPDDKYKVIYYDNVIKRMQIEIPKEEREQLKQKIPVEFAPNYELFVFDETLFEGTYIPQDPAMSDPDKSWYLNAINAQQAWDITKGSDKITIAIVDNGFNLKHPELNSKVIRPYNVWKHSDQINAQQEDHGTHVAGIALALADNGEGLCGIAPNCKFMPIQVGDDRGRMTTTSVLDGILYALYQGADVVNVSLTSLFSDISQLSENDQKDLINNHFKEEERLWREIMRIAANHNTTVVVAAGNNNALAGIDALQRPDLFITVSAVDKKLQSFTKANFSNYGSYSRISAPGVRIYSTVGDKGYKTMDGTSMAAPIVAGAVALMKSINPRITTKQILCILQNTGLETKGNIGKFIQLDKAVEKAKSGEMMDCTVTPSSGDVQILLNWNNYNDLDLHCVDPNGERIWFKNKRSASGGQLEIDMNVEFPDSRKPIENIFWEKGKAPKGKYKVFLMYFKKHESAINQTPYNVKLKYGNKSENYSGVIKQEDNLIPICTFVLGDSLNSSINLPDSSRHGNQPKDNLDRQILEQQKEDLRKEIKYKQYKRDSIGEELKKKYRN